MLGTYAKAELDPLAGLLGRWPPRPRLAEGNGVRFMNDLALRLGD